MRCWPPAWSASLERSESSSDAITVEVIARLALMISLVALSIDAMLPALGQIGEDLGATRVGDRQLIVTTLLLGLGLGQLLYGPLSDSVGRKPAIYAGLVLFMAGCGLSILATDFRWMLAGRFLQGLGVAGPRTVTVALVRDQYEGRAMARVMSFVMGVFIVVPALAPSLGQWILSFAHWRWIFGSFLGLSLVVTLWFGLRQPETLPRERRHPFSLRRIGRAVRETVSHRISLGYTLTAGLIFGAFVSYLSLAQPIFQVQYGLGERFPLYFAALALAIGAAAWLNGRLVVKLGMQLLTELALWVLSGLSILFLAVVMTLGEQPPLWALMGYLLPGFFCMGFLFGNMNALAIQPLGHIAGSAAAVIGALSTAISLLLATLVGRGYDGSVVPLVGAFALCSTAALGVMRRTERGAGRTPAESVP